MQASPSRSAYRWFPWGIAGAMGVVVAVNLVLTYFAFSSSTGLVSEHPFTEGNGYNAILLAGVRQDALGWRGEISFISTGAKAGRLVAAVKDKAGKPLEGLAVVAHIERPVEPLPPSTLALRDAGAGRYEAAASLSRVGQWDVRIVAQRGGERYEFAERIFVK